MVEAVRARVRAREALPGAAPVLVLLSGGRDSVCLLDLAVSLCPPATVSALHVNYGLREGADGDERHCRELCLRLGVPLAVHRPEPSSGGNLQAWARDQRYAAAAARAGDGLIAAGHTASDQVETILYRLASSPSRRALLGMREREGRLVRPLLSSTREETEAYCRERGLAWREDPTNASGDYARNRIRAELVPALRRVHPAAEPNVLALAEILRGESDLLDTLAEETLHGREEIPLAELKALPPSLGRLVLQRLADRARGRPAPGTARRLAEIVALRGTAELDLPHGVRAVVRAGTLRLSARP